MIAHQKIKCDCGKQLEEKMVKIDYIPMRVMVCPTCEFMTLTKEQAQLLKKRLHTTDFFKLLSPETQKDIKEVPKKEWVKFTRGVQKAGRNRRDKIFRLFSPKNL